MLSKRIISEIKSLQQVKYRNQSGLFVVEGEKVVKELLSSDLKIKLIAGLTEFLETVEASKLPDEVYEVSYNELSKVSSLSSPNKVIAVAEIPNMPLPPCGSLRGPVLILDGIKDPGNFGTIIRTSEWFGVKALICSEDCVDCFNSKVVQSAMGSLFRLPVYYTSLSSFLAEAKLEGRLKFLGATLNGASELPKISLNEMVLVIGSESHGISPDILKELDYEVTILASPHNKAESLNAAVACGILLQAFQK